MKKIYSVSNIDFMRFHPITLIFIASIFILIFSSGVIRQISAIIFLIIFVYVLIWLYYKIRNFSD